jgi:hypothetical protein
MDQNKKSGVGIKALPNEFNQSLVHFNKQINKNKHSTATSRPTYHRQFLCVLSAAAEPYFFLHKKADPLQRIGFFLQGHKTDAYIEVQRRAE